MDIARFDRLTTALAAGPSRRGVLRLIPGGGLLVLLSRADFDEAAARKKGKKKKKKCKGGTKKCGRRCIPKANCCTSANCPQGEVCRNGRCSNCVTADDCPTSDTNCQGPVCENGRCAKAQLPAGSNCFTGQFCVGNETCDAEGVCGGGIPRDCDDGVPCTDDSCNESINECVHTPNDSLCSANEICHPQQGCVCPSPFQFCEPGVCIDRIEQCP